MSVWRRFWRFWGFMEKRLRVSLFRTAGGNLRRAPESNVGDSSAGGITEWQNGFTTQSGSIWIGSLQKAVAWFCTYLGNLCLALATFFVLYFDESIESIASFLPLFRSTRLIVDNSKDPAAKTSKLFNGELPTPEVTSGTSKNHQPCRWQVFQ